MIEASPLMCQPNDDKPAESVQYIDPAIVPDNCSAINMCAFHKMPQLSGESIKCYRSVWNTKVYKLILNSYYENYIKEPIVW